MRLGRDDFAGVWQISRQITDRLGPDGEFVGTAALVPTGDNGLHYRETGQLTLADGTPMMAERQYVWRFVDNRVAVAFADGAAFHTFLPAGQAAGSDHPCGADHYRVRYDFTQWPQWRATWTVNGPRKDYASVSEYVRLDGVADHLRGGPGSGNEEQGTFRKDDRDGDDT